MANKTGVKARIYSILVGLAIAGAGYWWLDTRNLVEDSNQVTYELMVTFSPTYQDPGPLVVVKLGATQGYTGHVQHSPWVLPVTVRQGTKVLLTVTQEDQGVWSCAIRRNGIPVDARSLSRPGTLTCVAMA
jgi:hypothetical protein